MDVNSPERGEISSPYLAGEGCWSQSQLLQSLVEYSLKYPAQGHNTTE